MLEQRVETGRRRETTLDCFVDRASDTGLVAARACGSTSVPGSSTRKTLFASVGQMRITRGRECISR